MYLNVLDGRFYMYMRLLKLHGSIHVLGDYMTMAVTDEVRLDVSDLLNCDKMATGEYWSSHHTSRSQFVR